MHVAPGLALSPPQPDDETWMRAALAEAEAAAAKGEIPIGAVIVRDGELIAAGHNLRETERDPTGHAEMVAIRRAAARLGAWRLTGTTLYVTIEPCPMCAGALVLARIERLVYGAADPKAGACGTLWNLVQDPRLNHRLAVTAGVLEDECRAVIQAFFRRLRG
ncbi:MAG: tRNA adenosine(34) deaminase TadA [Bacillota bacterium]